MFDYDQNFKTLNFRENPWTYRVGRGEEGVLLVEPYKSELLPFWKFKSPKEAEKSAKKIFRKFLEYKADEDFIGMDMSRKYLQMGFTRSRRYANHKSGKKYLGPVPEELKGRSGSHGRDILPLDEDPEKAKSADIFYRYWKKAENDSRYRQMKAQWREWFG